MTTILLIRHATCDAVGVIIAGRAPGVHLNRAGETQAGALAGHLRTVPLDALYSSPLERSRETAAAIANGRDLTIRVEEAFTELDFGTWTGCRLDQLAADDTWGRFNEWRSLTRAPGGESMLEVQVRALAALERIRAVHADGVVAVVTHGDVIRAVLLHHLGLPLDHVHRLEVGPASVSVLQIWDSWVVVKAVNWTAEVPI
jgi:probable phosphomutase (TIGR03848 family)